MRDDLGHGFVSTVTYPTGPHGFVAVVGEAHYQEALRALRGRLGSDGVFTARLVPEPDNPHDAHAVAVCVEGDLAKVGYLAREVAKTYHPLLVRHGVPVTCPARWTGAEHVTGSVVLDFEAVRDAVAEYQRLNKANRLFGPALLVTMLHTASAEPQSQPDQRVIAQQLLRGDAGERSVALENARVLAPEKTGSELRAALITLLERNNKIVEEARRRGVAVANL